MSTERRALHAIMMETWAIMPDALDNIIAVANRESEYSGNVEALAAKLGRPLDNTERTTVLDGIATIPVRGPLFQRANLMTEFCGATSYQMLALDFAAARDDPSVEAIVLKFGTPGGVAFGAAEFSDMVFQARGIKPIVAYIEEQAASAGFWIAAAADRVISNPVAMAGSLGAALGVRSAPAPKDGEKSYEFVSSQSPLKRADPGTQEGADMLQKVVDDSAQVFIDSVAKYKGISPQEVLDKFGQGAVFVAPEALRRGMIDGIGSYESVIASLKQEVQSMDYTKLTAAELAEHRPDLVAAIRTEAAAGVKVPDVEAARKEAAIAERERIAGIHALAMPGTNDLVASLVADGTSVDAAAVKILQAVRAQGSNKGTAFMQGLEQTEKKLDAPKPTASADNADDPIESMIALGHASGVIRK